MRAASRVPVRLAAAAVSLLIVHPALAERPRVYAVTGARIAVSPDRVIETGTIVLRDGLVEAVGPSVAPPADAEVIDGAGLHVTAAFIDPDTSLGQRDDNASRGPSGQRTDAGSPARAGAVHPIGRVTPEENAADALTPFAGDATRPIEKLREQGIAIVHTSRARGIFRGRGATLLLLDDASVPELLLLDRETQHVSFERGGFGDGYPTSLMGAAATIRQALLDADRHAEWTRRYERQPSGMERPPVSAALAALRPLVDGRARAVFHVSSPEDALLAGRLAAEFSLDAVIAGSGHEWEVAPRFAARGALLVIPVAFPDDPDMDDEHERLDVSIAEMRRVVGAPAGPAALHAAGVSFAFTTRGLDRLSQSRENVAAMIAEGLPERAALAAWTTVPARLLGLESIAGTLERGRLANVAVWDGPPFAETTRLTRLFVEGVEYRMKEKTAPKGADPDALVDPRGEWSVVMEFGPRTIERTWSIEGERGRYRGSAETQEGSVDFEEVRLEGNLMTVVFPARGGRPASEVQVVIRGNAFEGSAEMGPRTIRLRGTREAVPDGGEGR